MHLAGLYIRSQMVRQTRTNESWKYMDKLNPNLDILLITTIHSCRTNTNLRLTMDKRIPRIVSMTTILKDH